MRAKNCFDMKLLLYGLLLLLFLLLAAAGNAIYRLGGWNYTLHRLQHPNAGVYQHRIQHFERLDERPGAIVFVGDSQIAQAEWHELFGDSPAVLNRGVSGDFTEGVLGRLPEVLRHKPLKIFLLVGVNDLIHGTDLSKTEHTFRRIVQKIRTESPDTELFLQSVLPVNNKIRRSGTHQEQVLTLNARIEQIAREYALPYLDIAEGLKDADGNLAAKFTEDGLHLNGLGYAVWKQKLKPLLGRE